MSNITRHRAIQLEEVINNVLDGKLLVDLGATPNGSNLPANTGAIGIGTDFSVWWKSSSPGPTGWYQFLDTYNARTWKNIVVSDTDSGYTWYETTTLFPDAYGSSLNLVSGTGIDIDAGEDGSNVASIRIAHSSVGGTSISSDNSNGVVIQDLTATIDASGHVTATSVGTLDLDGRYYTETELTNGTIALTLSSLSVYGNTITLDADTGIADITYSYAGGTITFEDQYDYLALIAKRFTDGDGSSYFLDPANTSLSLVIAGKEAIGDTSADSLLHIKQSADTHAGGIKLTQSATDDTWSIYQNTSEILVFDWASAGDGSPTQSIYMYSTDGSVRAPRHISSGFAQAPIFYATDSTYYGDFDNTSTSIKTAGSVILGDTTTPDSRLHIKQSADSHAGGIKLTQSATDDTWSIYQNDSEDLYFGYSTAATGSTAKMYLTESGQLVVTGDMRAPIFYDSADSGYYLNLNGTGIGLNLAGDINAGTDADFLLQTRNTTYGKGTFRAMKLTSTHTNSYYKRVILIVPFSETAASADCMVMGRISGLKPGGNVFDTFDVYAQSVWNDTEAWFTSHGQMTGHKWVTCTYNSVKWLAIEPAYTANPRTTWNFEGYADGNGSADLLKVVAYYDVFNTTVINTEINSSIANWTSSSMQMSFNGLAAMKNVSGYGYLALGHENAQATVHIKQASDSHTGGVKITQSATDETWSVWQSSADNLGFGWASTGSGAATEAIRFTNGGTILAAKFGDYADSNYYLDPADTTLSLNIAGGITMAAGKTFTFDSVGLTAVQTSGEAFSDNDTSLMTSAAIDDRIAAVGGLTLADLQDGTADLEIDTLSIGQNAVPSSNLHIKQGADSHLGGIKITESATTDTWSMYVGTDEAIYWGYDTTTTGFTAKAYLSSGGQFYPYGGVNSPATIYVDTTSAGGILRLNGGDGGDGSSNLAQIRLGYNGTTDYPHFIVSRHQSAGGEQNAIDFYTCDSTQAGVYPTNAVHSMTLENGKVGVLTTTPESPLHVVCNVDSDTGVGGLKIQEYGGTDTFSLYMYNGNLRLGSASTASGTTNLEWSISTSSTWFNQNIAISGYLNLDNHVYFGSAITSNTFDASTEAVDWTLSNIQLAVISTNVTTLTFTDPTGPTMLYFKVQQTAGSNTITWPSQVKWPSGTAPTLTTTAGRYDIILFLFDGTYYNGMITTKNFQ